MGRPTQYVSKPRNATWGNYFSHTTNACTKNTTRNLVNTATLTSFPTVISNSRQKRLLRMTHDSKRFLKDLLRTSWCLSHTCSRASGVGQPNTASWTYLLFLVSIKVTNSFTPISKGLFYFLYPPRPPVVNHITWYKELQAIVISLIRPLLSDQIGALLSSKAAFFLRGQVFNSHRTITLKLTLVYLRSKFA